MFPTRDPFASKIKYAGRSKAVVIDIRDPQKRGRIKVKHPVIGESSWIEYVNSSSTFDPPSVGDIVYIEADCGHTSYCFAHGSVNKVIEGVTELPTQFQKEGFPSNRGLHTPGGHFIELDDGDVPASDDPTKDKEFTTANRGIRITSKAGNKIHVLEDTDAEQEKILIETSTGDKIELDYKNNKLVIQTAGEIEVAASGEAKLKLKEGKVALGAGDELLDLVSQLTQLVSDIATANSTETHPTGVGPSGPPVNAADYTAAISSLATLKSKVDGIKGSL